MKNVLSAIEKYNKLSDDDKKLLLDKLEPVRLKKGETLIHELEKSPYFYFIEEGAVKTNYIDEKGNKKVVWFGFEKDICFSQSAYFNVEYVNETIDLLEDTLFYRVKIKEIKELYNQYCSWANWGRNFIEFHFTETIKEMDEYKSRKAKDRYIDLINNKPHIHMRVPLKEIASYLGVSAVTISRLRKEL